MISRIEKLTRSLTENTILIGVVSLFWLLFRSGTKPSRIVYPCQKVATANCYMFLLCPIAAFLAGLSRRVVPEVFDAVKHSSRRNLIILAFLLSLSVVSSGLAIYGNIIVNPFNVLRERTTLVERLTSVSVVRVENNGVQESLEMAINQIGGIDALVPEGSKVLIKPNIVRNQAPPDTIDPTIVKALINIIRKRNPSVMWVGDGSGEGNTTQNFLSLGYSAIANEAGVELVDLNSDDLVNVPVPGGGVVFENFLLSRKVVDADVFISLACMKTHDIAVVTLGMKNLIGIAPGSIYGFPKSILHQKAQDKNDNYMAGVIVDLCRVRKIDLAIIDGRVGMEGQGPHEGTPVNLNLMIVGKDPVATDSVASAIMGFDPEKVPTLKIGQEKGVGTNDLHKIEIKGEKIEEVFYQFVCAQGHDSFQMFSSIHLFLFRWSTLLVLTSAGLWALTLLLGFWFRYSKKIPKSPSNVNQPESLGR